MPIRVLPKSSDMNYLCLISKTKSVRLTSEIHMEMWWRVQFSEVCKKDRGCISRERTIIWN